MIQRFRSNRSFLILVLAKFLLLSNLFSQTIDDVVDVGDEVIGGDDILLRLEEVLENPLDMNRVTTEELTVVPGIDVHLANKIIKLRDEVGGFDSIEQIGSVAGMTVELLEKIKPYLVVVRVKPRVAKHPVSFYKFRQRYQENFGDTDSSSESFLESKGLPKKRPYRFYSKINGNLSGKYKFGYLMEKDPFELDFTDSQKFYIAYSSDGLLKKVVVGNLLWEVGNGILFWSPYGINKSSDGINSAKRSGKGVRGDLTTNEGLGLYGAGATIGVRSLEFTFVVSKSKVDGRANDEGAIESIDEDGIHLPESTIEENILSTTALGGHLEYRLSSVDKLGLTYAHFSYDPPLRPDVTERNIFEFAGDEQHFVGFNWEFLVRNLNIFGEAAIDLNDGRGFIFGLQQNLSGIQTIFLFRDYSRDFNSPLGFSFADKTGDLQNERGFYTGISFRPRKGTHVSFFYDQFNHPFRRFFEPFPSEGRDILVEMIQSIGKNVNVLYRYTRSFGEKGRTDEEVDLAFNFDQKRQRNRFQLEWLPPDNIRLRFRYDFTIFDLETEMNSERGDLFFIDLRWGLNKKTTVYSRFIMYDTDSFSAAVYQFENDLRGVLRNRAMFNTGNRWYVYVKRELMNDLDLSFKVGNTRQDGDESDTRSEYDIGFQVDYKFSH